MTHETNKVKLGKLGEHFYNAVFGGELSADMYDSEMDLRLDDGTSVELKTQCRHPNGSFTVDTAKVTDFQKCLKVDKLVFIEYSLSDIITVYECNDRSHFTTTTSDQRRMACFPIKNMHVVMKVKHPKMAQDMRSLSSSRTLKHHD